jgi:NADPH:quinone reductase-like Zn-dependent oxidoreductase
MKGLTLAKQGAPYELASDIGKPAPGPKQVLVKSLYTGINPVYASQSFRPKNATDPALGKHSCK